MINFRQLDIGDAESAIELINSRPEVFMGKLDDDFKNNIIEALPSVLLDPLCFNLGIFRDDKLISLGLFKEMTTQPAWVWVYWVTKQGDQKTMINVQTVRLLDKMMDILFEEMESRGLHRFYIAYKHNSRDETDLRSMGASDRLLEFMTRYKKSHQDQYNFRITEYKFFTDCIVPAYTNPKYTYQQSILGNRLWPFDLDIQIGMLDQSKERGS
jgi:hypothetical protein